MPEIESLEVRALPSPILPAAKVHKMDNIDRLIQQLRPAAPDDVALFRNLAAWSYASIRHADDGLTLQPNDLLAALVGQCGEKDMLVQEVARRLGYPAQRVNLTNVPYCLGHSATNVCVGGAWRFVDATMGVYFTLPDSADPVSFRVGAEAFPLVTVWQAVVSAPWSGVWSPAASFTFAPLPADSTIAKDGAPFFDVTRGYFESRTPAWSFPVAGDFTGNGRLDVAAYDPSTGNWWVGQNTGAGYTAVRWGQFSSLTGWKLAAVGDFDGNGKDDLAVYHEGTGRWWVGTSTGAAFAFRLWGTFSTLTGWDSPQAADFDGDGRDDLRVHHQNGSWWTGTSTGAAFNFRRSDAGTLNPAALPPSVTFQGGVWRVSGQPWADWTRPWSMYSLAGLPH